MNTLWIQAKNADNVNAFEYSRRIKKTLLNKVFDMLKTVILRYT